MSSENEVERKFLVLSRPGGLGQADVIRQGYLTLPEDSIEMRLRQINDATYLTVKTGEGLIRGEREVSITQAQFDALWPLTDGRRVEKQRSTGRLECGAVFELDVFEAGLAPLCLVEVEFESAAQAEAFEAPDWFGRDVTLDKRYKNKALAISGCPDEGA